MSRRKISLVSNDELLLSWLREETGSLFTVAPVYDFRSEVKRFSSQDSVCVFLDADTIPELYLKILYRLMEGNSVPTVLICRKNNLSSFVNNLYPKSLCVNMITDKGFVLAKLNEYLKDVNKSEPEQKVFIKYSFNHTSSISPFLHVNTPDKEYSSGPFDIFCGSSPKMKEFKRLVTEAAGNENIVLLTGESGTGKSFTAQYIHEHSVRSKREMRYINVADIVPSLAESELFGVEKGAYTSAVVKSGIFEAAEGSTLFLDEIGELSYELQSKLLDVIETKTFMKVGSVSRKAFDTRLIFATNTDINRKISRSQFRRDLYYRIAVLTIEVPPLREHMEDLPLLAKNFVTRRMITSSALDKLCSHSWPGNIRELKNVLYRADAFCSGEEIRADDITFC